MATVRRSQIYKIEEHFTVGQHYLIRTAQNRYHWWHHDESYPARGTEMVMDDFGNLVAIN